MAAICLGLNMLISFFIGPIDVLMMAGSIS